jgi:hypothetical protein
VASHHQMSDLSSYLTSAIALLAVAYRLGAMVHGTFKARSGSLRSARGLSTRLYWPWGARRCDDEGQIVVPIK